MKHVPTIIAWVGVAIILVASWPTFSISWQWITHPETAGRVTEGVIVSFALGILGLFLALIGGSFSRPRIVAGGIIAAGAVYLLAFIPWMILGNDEWVLALFPGVFCLIGGGILLASRYRGWWLAAVFGVPVVIAISAVGISALLNAPEYQPTQLQPPEVGCGEIMVTLGATSGHYHSLVTTEVDGYTWEYLRTWNQSTGSQYIAVEAPQNGMLIPLLHTDNIPLDQISVPGLGYREWEELSPTESMLVEYHEKGMWSFNMRPVCVSYTKRGSEERYVIFRLKEHIPGEFMVVEYRYVQPATT